MIQPANRRHGGKAETTIAPPVSLLERVEKVMKAGFLMKVLLNV
jgi:hypothetical protein